MADTLTVLGVKTMGRATEVGVLSNIHEATCIHGALLGPGKHRRATKQYKTARPVYKTWAPGT